MDRKKQQVPSLRFAPVRGCDFFNLLWPESCEEHLPISIAGVLRLRAASPVLNDRSARRFAQDDDSVVGIKNIGSSAKNTKRSKKSQALGMTILLKEATLSNPTELSSRPERSVVEGPAVCFTGNEGWVPHSSRTLA